MQNLSKQLSPIHLRIMPCSVLAIVKYDYMQTFQLLKTHNFFCQIVPLDIFKETRHNKDINNKLDAWLTFFSTDKPEEIIKLITVYPEFKPMYDNIYELCCNVERVMNMFSKELQMLDENTVQYMIDEMQDEMNEMQETIEEQKKSLAEKDKLIQQLQEQLAKKE